MISLENLKIFVNGKYISADQPGISVFDRGFLYGDAVFEGIREYAGRVFKLDEHVQRLYVSAHVFQIVIPYTDTELKEIILQTLRINNLQDAHIRPIVSRGLGVGVGPEKDSASTVVVIAHPWKPFLSDKGIRVKTVSIRKTPSYSFDARVKCTGSYINGIMGKLESNSAKFDEALLLDHQGYVAEGPGSNFFAVRNGTLLSPIPINILDGITRQTVRDMALELKISYREKNLTLADIYACDEAFMCGTGAEISPVREIDGRPVLQEAPGPVTQKLTARYRELVNTTGTLV
jgi:branched-chain amino acid aminotransferase